MKLAYKASILMAVLLFLGACKKHKKHITEDGTTQTTTLKIISIAPMSGEPGESVVIYYEGPSVSSVKFNGTSAPIDANSGTWEVTDAGSRITLQGLTSAVQQLRVREAWREVPVLMNIRSGSRGE